jgi:hypothetical protein
VCHPDEIFCKEVSRVITENRAEVGLGFLIEEDKIDTQNLCDQMIKYAKEAEHKKYDRSIRDLLTHQIAHVLGYGVGKLHMVLGDTHIYNDHKDAVMEQLTRTPSEAPTLRFNRLVDNIEDFTLSDFELVGYVPQATISAKMST